MFGFPPERRSDALQIIETTKLELGWRSVTLLERFKALGSLPPAPLVMRRKNRCQIYSATAVRLRACATASKGSDNLCARIQAGVGLNPVVAQATPRACDSRVECCPSAALARDCACRTRSMPMYCHGFL